MSSANRGQDEATFAQLQADWAAQVVESLVQAGVADAVVCPGSRSTPLALALSRSSAIRAIAVSDERSAAFFALGQAKVSGAPSVLVCTSGSAAGHFFPAVMEASASRLPLLVITANRPIERDHCEAPQTTDQRRLFGSHARGFFEIGTADALPRSLRAVARTAAQAVALTQWPLAGPVQIDVRARKPLQPSRSDGPGSRASCSTPAILPPSMRMAASSIADLAERVQAAQRPLIVAGPTSLAAQKLRSQAKRMAGLGIPGAFELTSQLRGCGELSTLSMWMQAPSFRAAVRPDFVLQLGGAPINGGWEPWIESLVEMEGVDHCVLAENGLPDPVSTASRLLVGELDPALDELLGSLSKRPSWHDWYHRLERLDAVALDLIAVRVKAGTTEGRVAHLVCKTPPISDLLALGNSLAVRLAETYGDRRSSGRRSQGQLVWHQRGLSGIDGIVSGVAGSLHALGNSKGPVSEDPREVTAPSARLLIGDVSLLHDVSGLGLLRDSACAQLDVVVIDNGGGRIFDRLPVQGLGLSREQKDLFATPHGADFEAAAAVYGLSYKHARDCDNLATILSERSLVSGARLIRIETEAGQEAIEHSELLSELDAALPGAWEDSL